MSSLYLKLIISDKILRASYQQLFKPLMDLIQHQAQYSLSIFSLKHGAQFPIAFNQIVQAPSLKTQQILPSAFYTLPFRKEDWLRLFDSLWV